MKPKVLTALSVIIIMVWALSSCSTTHETVEIGGQKVPIAHFSDEQIQADAWALTYMTCETELLKRKSLADSNNRKLKHDLMLAERSRKLFFNRLYVRYFQDSTYKHKFLEYQDEGKKLFRPCQQLEAIKHMENQKK